MDIEGYEWDVIATFGTEPGWRESMPVQMAIEFHTCGGVDSEYS
jgi:hypothetical protein